MSRVSQGRRLDRLFEHFRPGDSLEGRIARLCPADRERYDAFERCNARLMAKHDANGGEAFEAWLEGRLVLDELPDRIADQLAPERVAAREAVAAGDVYGAWQRMSHPHKS